MTASERHLRHSRMANCGDNQAKPFRPRGSLTIGAKRLGPGNWVSIMTYRFWTREYVWITSVATAERKELARIRIEGISARRLATKLPVFGPCCLRRHAKSSNSAYFRVPSQARISSLASRPLSSMQSTTSIEAFCGLLESGYNSDKAFFTQLT